MAARWATQEMKEGDDMAKNPYDGLEFHTKQAHHAAQFHGELLDYLTKYSKTLYRSTGVVEFSIMDDVFRLVKDIVHTRVPKWNEALNRYEMAGELDQISEKYKSVKEFKSAQEAIFPPVLSNPPPVVDPTINVPSNSNALPNNSASASQVPPMPPLQFSPLSFTLTSSSSFDPHQCQGSSNSSNVVNVPEVGTEFVQAEEPIRNEPSPVESVPRSLPSPHSSSISPQHSQSSSSEIRTGYEVARRFHFFKNFDITQHKYFAPANVRNSSTPLSNVTHPIPDFSVPPPNFNPNGENFVAFPPVFPVDQFSQPPPPYQQYQNQSSSNCSSVTAFTEVQDNRVRSLAPAQGQPSHHQSASASQVPPMPPLQFFPHSFTSPSSSSFRPHQNRNSSKSNNVVNVPEVATGSEFVPADEPIRNEPSPVQSFRRSLPSPSSLSFRPHQNENSSNSSIVVNVPEVATGSEFVQADEPIRNEPSPVQSLPRFLPSTHSSSFSLQQSHYPSSSEIRTGYEVVQTNQSSPIRNEPMSLQASSPESEYSGQTASSVAISEADENQDRGRASEQLSPGSEQDDQTTSEVSDISPPPYSQSPDVAGNPNTGNQQSNVGYLYNLEASKFDDIYRNQHLGITPQSPEPIDDGNINGQVGIGMVPDDTDDDGIDINMPTTSGPQLARYGSDKTQQSVENIRKKKSEERKGRKRRGNSDSDGMEEETSKRGRTGMLTERMDYNRGKWKQSLKPCAPTSSQNHHEREEDNE